MSAAIACRGDTPFAAQPAGSSNVGPFFSISRAVDRATIAVAFSARAATPSLTFAVSTMADTDESSSGESTSISTLGLGASTW